MSQIQRIRFVRQLVGPRLNWRVGDKAWVGDGPGMVSPADARRLVDAGIAEVLRSGEPIAEPKLEPEPEPPPVEEPEVETEPVIETATVEPPENAATQTVRRRGRPRKKG